MFVTLVLCWGCAPMFGATPSPVVSDYDASPSERAAVANERGCELSELQMAALDARWRSVKRAHVSHPAGWLLEDADIDEAVDYADDPGTRRALRRLYEDLFGSTLFFHNGELTGASLRTEIALVSLEDETLPPYKDLLADLAPIRKELHDELSRGLSSADAAILCRRAHETGAPTVEFTIDHLTPTTLSSLSRLDELQRNLRRAVARIDGALVIGTWAVATDRKRAGEVALEVPDWLLLAAGRTGDVDAMTRAVYAALRYDGFKKPFSEVRHLIRKVVTAAEHEGIDPFIAVTVVFLESRFRPGALGDGGLACGLAQQHAEFSMHWGLSDTLTKFSHVRDPTARAWRQRKYECQLLMNPDYAIKVLMHVLKLIKRRAPNLDQSVCRYNEGPYAPCEGRGLFYLRKHEWWRQTIEVAYNRILDKSNAPDTPAEPSSSNTVKADAEPDSAGGDEDGDDR